jgi:hypothetical protein
MIEVNEILATLAKRRPIFHSEADFQHSLAWEIHQKIPSAFVCLELPVQVKNEYFHVDVWVKHQDEILAIELKYKTRGLSIEIDGEHYILSNQSAQDIGRYDFIKDIQRLEHIASGQNNFVGYAILVTNDSAYWIKPTYHDTVDSKFRINNERVLEGIFEWGPNASDGTKKSREQSLILQNKYVVQWLNFSHPSLESYGEFRSLANKVKLG